MPNTTISTMLATTAALALAACGGGGGGSSVPFQISPERLFLDGAGVARGKNTNGAPVIVMIDDIGGFVDFVQTNSSFGSVEGRDLNNLSIVQTLPTNANIRQGADNSGSLVGNLTVVEDLGGQAVIRLAEFPNTNIVLVTVGDRFSSSLVGSHTYTGTFITGFRDADPEIEYGSFSLSANFNNNSFVISGSNDFDTLSGSGSMNTTTGTLASNSLVMNTNGIDRAASLYGNLHGDNAQSVSGVFHSNAASQYYIGAFVGSR